MATLQLARAEGVLTVTMDRPERRNAIDDAMWDELEAVARSAGPDPDVRCVVLTGAVGAFCSGADLAGGGGGPRLHQLAQMRRINAVVQAWHDLPQPTIAKVTGVAAGVGFSLALGCDLVVASPEARFSAIFAKRGLSLDGGLSWLLPRSIGVHRAKELALFAHLVDAEEGARLGFVNRVVAADEIDAFVAGWARQLAAGPPIALAMTKRLLDRSFEQPFEQALDDEARTQTVNFGTADTVEAISAFLEKRDAEFRGR
ncbi:MAG: enoyl-CoA hydratase/isomerase family protein [Acidimicrobiia bacterium]